MNIPVSKSHPLNDTTQLIFFLFAWGIHNESSFLGIFARTGIAPRDTVTTPSVCMCVCSYIQSHAPTHTAKIRPRRPPGVTRRWQHSFPSLGLGYAAVERGRAIPALAASSDRAPNRQGGYLQGKAGQGLRTLRVTPKQCRLLRGSQRELSLGGSCPQGWEQLPALGSPHRAGGCGTLGLGCYNSPCEEQQQGCWAQAPRASNSWTSCSCSNGSDTV